MFNLRKIENGRMNVPEPEYLPTKPSESYVEGETLILSNGTLTKASGTTKPTHIAMKTYAAPTANCQALPCFRITENMIFSAPVTFSTTANAVVVGAKLTVYSDGLGVTDVTTGGVATVVDALNVGTQNGEEILVRFE